ncbi:MAG: DUF1439 domain-containing protein [Arenicellales bacterium]
MNESSGRPRGTVAAKKLIVAACIVVVAAAIFLAMRRGYVYEVSQAQIQSQLDRQFPVDKCVLVFCLELKQPFVHLTERHTRIEFGSAARMKVAFSKDQYDGEAGFSGGLKYVGAKGAFYLDDSKLEYLKVSGVSEKSKQSLDQIAAALIKQYLSANPIYKFKGSVARLIAPWLELKEVSVHDGILRVRLGLAV